MKTPLKLGAFVGILVAVLAASFAIGNAVGPVEQDSAQAKHAGGHGAPRTSGPAGSSQAGEGARGSHGGTAAAAIQPGGLMVSEHGYTLAMGSATQRSGRMTVTFQVRGPDGKSVTRFQPTHDKQLHLIAVRRDMTGFQHLHPTMDAAGTWSTPVDLTPGVWRFFADFQPTGRSEAMTLGSDVSVAGGYAPRTLPPPSTVARVGDYTVTLRGALTPGTSSKLTLSVARGGKPVTDLQPYLAAYGHLVALRSGDLAYLHVHPDGEPGDGKTKPGPDTTFFATAPSAGPYRLFLDFRHGGVVRTAEFTVNATGPSSGPAQSTPPAATGTTAPDGHGHNH